MGEEKSRLAWVDSARGIGIVLVVLGHVERGLAHGQFETWDWLGTLDRWIYAFHMPLFFALSGLFASGARRGHWGQFVGGRARRIMYPYFVWATLQTGLQVLMSSRTNSETTLGDLLSIPLVPPMQFWFLYALFIVSILHALILSLSKSHWVVCVVSLLLYLLQDYSPMAWEPLQAGLHHLPYFSFAAAGASFLTSPRFSSRPSLELTLGALCLAGVGLALRYPGFNGLLLGLLGTVGTLFVAMAIGDTPRFEFLRRWGRASLEIYVAHTLASAGFRIILLQLGVHDMAIHLVGGLVAGIAFPLALLKTTRKLNFQYLFVLPSTKTRITMPDP